MTVAISQGLINLVKHLIDKNTKNDERAEHNLIMDKLEDVKAKVNRQCGLNQLQSTQLNTLYEWHGRMD